MTLFREIMRAAPCSCGATWEKLEIAGQKSFYVRCTVCKNCERGASPTHALAVDAWNDACWGSPSWRAAFDRRREQQFRTLLHEHVAAGAQAIAEKIDADILASLMKEDRDF